MSPVKRLSHSKYCTDSSKWCVTVPGSDIFIPYGTVVIVDPKIGPVRSCGTKTALDNFVARPDSNCNMHIDLPRYLPPHCSPYPTCQSRAGSSQCAVISLSRLVCSLRAEPVTRTGDSRRPSDPGVPIAGLSLAGSARHRPGSRYQTSNPYRDRGPPQQRPLAGGKIARNLRRKSASAPLCDVKPGGNDLWVGSG